MSTIEARAARRIPVNNRVNLLVPGRGILAAGAANIGPGGVFVNAVCALPIGSACDVAIFAADGGGTQAFTTTGRIVRAGIDGLAIQFSRMLGPQTLDALAGAAGKSLAGTLVDDYQNYFRVSQGAEGFDCERIFGLPLETFRSISTASFLISIPTAILPVWLFRNDLPPAPNGVKILGCFIYAALWLLVFQPALDLAIIRALRARGQGGIGHRRNVHR